MTAWDDGLTQEQKDDFLAAYYATERARIRAEWLADGAYEHECEMGETSYAGGCSVCGAQPENQT